MVTINPFFNLYFLSIMKNQDEHQMTFEEMMQLDKELSTADFSTQEAAALDVAGKLRQVCVMYKRIKGALNIILSIPFVPGSIKTAIRAFMSLMNTVCA